MFLGFIGRVPPSAARVHGFLRIGNLLLLVMAIVAPLSAQELPTGEKTIQKLLAELVGEVRMLRNSLTLTSARQSRIQIEVERYRVQTDALNLVTNRLEDTRTELAAAIDSVEQFSHQKESAEAELGTTADATRRVDLESALKQVAANLDERKRQESQLREKEVRLAGTLRVEEAKLSVINSRLDAIASQLQVLETAK